MFDNHNGSQRGGGAEDASGGENNVAGRKLEGGAEAIAAPGINQLRPVGALTKLYELQRRVIGQHWN